MEPAKKIKVRCIFDIDVEVPADMDDHSLQFMIEENSCPGMGCVGSAFDKHYQLYNAEKAGFCWACALGGTNMILKDREAKHENR